MPSGERNAEKTHCDHGHEFTPANTYIDRRGWRICRTCKRQYQRESAARAKARGLSVKMHGTCPVCGGPKTTAARVTHCKSCMVALELENRVWSTIHGLQQYAALFGRPPTSLEWPAFASMFGCPTTTQVQSDFGSWSQAIRLAGMDPRQRGRDKYLKPSGYRGRNH